MFGSYLPDRFVAAQARVMMKKFRERLAPVADIFIGETLGSIEEVTTFLVCLRMSPPIWVSVTLEGLKVEAGTPRLRSGGLWPTFWTILRHSVMTPCYSIAVNRGHGRGGEIDADNAGWLFLQALQIATAGWGLCQCVSNDD